MVTRLVVLIGLATLMTCGLGACASKNKASDTATAEPAGGDPWYRAARQGDLRTIQTMVDAGKDVNAKSPVGLTAMMVAARAGQLETVKWFLSHGADASILDRDEQSALVYALVGFAADQPRAEMAGLLAKAGSDPFKIDKLGFQPILEMMDQGMDDQIRSLKFSRKKPCDLVPKNPGEATLSRMARRMENIPLAEFLEAQGCW